MSNLQRLLKESWTLVEEEQDKLAGYFYARMFLSHPQTRDLFPVTMDVQRARAARRDRHRGADRRRSRAVRRIPPGARPRPPEVPRRSGALRRRRLRAAGGAADVRRRALVGRLRPGVARRLHRDRGKDAGRRGRRGHAAVLARRGDRARAPGYGHRRLHGPAAPAAGLPGRPIPEHRMQLPAPAVAGVLGRQRSPQGQHDRLPRPRGRRRLGVQRAGPPPEGRRHDPRSRRRWAR